MTEIKRIGYHARVRFVERIWKIANVDDNQMSQYVGAKQSEIDEGILDLVENSFLVFKKLYTEAGKAPSMRSYHYNEQNGLIIITDDEMCSVVTMFEPRLPGIPAALRSKDVTLGMAKIISNEYVQLEAFYDTISHKTETLVTDREVLINQIERLKVGLESIDRELSVAWKPYDAMERKVVDMGNYLVEIRGSQNEEAKTN